MLAPGAPFDAFATEIAKEMPFYPAEEYHRNYFQRNPSKAYCAAVIAPKVAKARRKFLAKLKN